MAPVFLQCESHPGRSLTNHLLDVAERLSVGDGMDSLLRIAGLFHDLGKATGFFQSHLHGRPCDPHLKQHAQFGAVWLLDFLNRKAIPSEPNSLLEAILHYLIVRRHHGRLDDLVDSLTSPAPDEYQRWLARLSAADVDGAKVWLESQLGETVEIPRPEENWWTQIRVELLRRLPPFTKISDLEAFARFQSALRAFGRLIEADRDSASGFIETPTARRFTKDDLTQFRTESNFGAAAQPQIARVRELIYRHAVAQAVSRPCGNGHLWTLEVPTGAGKTLAALGWAIERRRLRVEAGQVDCPIIYALPFTSIIDQTATVMRGICPGATSDPSILAIHHHLADPPEGEGRSLSQNWAENWRADVICTTFVQVVNALFHGTCADSRRFAQLTGSILILDEVQAIRADLWPVLRTSLTSLSKNFCTDILLVTATQPAIFANEEAAPVGPAGLPRELMSAFDRYDLLVQTAEPLTISSLARRLERVLSYDASSPSCLVILNTVQEALDLHESISQSGFLSSLQLLHLSTNLRPKDRTTILEELRQANRAPCILVATQVVEAGVDLSFDVVFRAIAPLDAIIQAAGRCNRHGTGKRGEVIVFKLEGNSDRLIYGDVHMDVARRLLSEIAEIGHPLPEPALTGLVRSFFAEVSQRKERSKSRFITEGVAMLQFAALRGEGDDRHSKEKAVQLIEDQENIVPHFIETDETDEVVWREFNDALLIADGRKRRQRLRGLRSAIAQRVVEVRKKYALGTADEKTGLVHVPRSISAKNYDCATGWRRNR
jgi:CRISPR-associated endonuclease/helicase Cas3